MAGWWAAAPLYAALGLGRGFGAPGATEDDEPVTISDVGFVDVEVGDIKETL